MFDTGNNSNRVRRLLRAAMPATPPPPRIYVLVPPPGLSHLTGAGGPA